MSLDPTLDQDPNGAGSDAGTQAEPIQPAPAGRYTDADMAAARRSFEADASRREARLRAEFESRYVPKEQPKPSDAWEELLDPSIAPKFRAALEAEFERRNAPIRQQQEDLAFKNDEARISAKYPDYSKNRDAILAFAVQAGIGNVDVAYHAWRSQTQWQDPEAIGKKYLADYQKKKSAQASSTPAVEGRGGGAPSSKQNLKTREEMDEAVEAMLRSANDNAA